MLWKWLILMLTKMPVLLSTSWFFNITKILIHCIHFAFIFFMIFDTNDVHKKLQYSMHMVTQFLSTQFQSQGVFFMNCTNSTWQNFLLNGPAPGIKPTTSCSLVKLSTDYANPATKSSSQMFFTQGSFMYFLSLLPYVRQPVWVFNIMTIEN